MSITIPLLLLFIFVFILWLLTESKVNVFWKLLSITSVCVFTVVFWVSAKTLMGWSTDASLLPDVVTIHSIVIKEPNKNLNINGAMFFWIETAFKKRDSFLLEMFGYSQEQSEPRAFRLPYSRKLHKQLEESGAIASIGKGQIVRGKLVKIKKNGEKDQNGDGSESLETEWMFYNLKPSYFQPKN